MGNTGAPSRGCRNCKKARVKCDEALPSCSLCTRRKLTCGYKSDFDLLLIDQTASVKANWGKKKRTAKPKVNTSRREVSTKDASCAKPEMSLTKKTSFSISHSQGDIEMEFPRLVVPTNVTSNVERFALAFWYDRYVDVELDAASPQNFLQLHPQVYATAKPNGTLERATSAMAFLACSLNLEEIETRHPFFIMGRTAFGDAMRQLTEAVQDPEEAQKDETLMAGMLLNVVEAILAIADHREPSKAHLSGALALIQLRGSKNFSTPVGQRMLAGVHSALIGIAFHKSIPVQPILTGASSKTWIDDLKALPRSPSSQLTYLAEVVANVQAAVRAALDASEILVQSDVAELLTLVSNTDDDLSAWEQDLSPEWHPIPAADLSSANLKRYDAYGALLDTYTSVWVANMYNSFRVVRLILQLLIQELLCRSSIGGLTALPFGPASHVRTIQRLADEICASVPFFIGNKQVGLDPDLVEFPRAPSPKLTDSRRVNRRRPSTWFMFAPLYICARCCTLRPGQMNWIQRQIDRLERLHLSTGGPRGPSMAWQTSLVRLPCKDNILGTGDTAQDEFQRTESFYDKARRIGAHLPKY